MAARYEVRILKGAQKELESLPTDIRLQVLTKMKVLEVDPLPKGKPEIKILRGFRPPLLRLGSGDFRVVYRLSGQAIEVLAVVNRKELERKLRQLRN